ncbi:5-demethoxyubiquinone hydroxylase, mitochondrial [Sciurus carolinensis]|uniref:5-demethoxyubiquinone hydroxylase, mitochondrial n=1 Tax=Sciurus carolinensis TaxID=30640 RepID=A0AA41T0L4_SCICA|nr:5-demethoxyubiquinone hydroxylase, mitochondrial [Sciurus carolinensis]
MNQTASMRARGLSWAGQASSGHSENVGSRKGPFEEVPRADGGLPGPAHGSHALLERGGLCAGGRDHLAGEGWRHGLHRGSGESIAHHYNNHIRTLMEEDPERHQERLQVMKQFRDEELQHQNLGLEHDAELAPVYTLLKSAIQAGSSAVIYQKGFKRCLLIHICHPLMSDICRERTVQLLLCEFC